jgi:twitching motility protein PilT
MLLTLDALGGSDLHLRSGCPARARVNGDLRALPGFNALSVSDLEQIVRAVVPDRLSGHLATDGDADTAYTSATGARFRAHAYRQRGNVALVLRRVLDEPRTVEQLRLPPVTLRLADQQRGLVLVCGPTGSGKTSTLGAMVDHVNRTRPVHIVTLEDPIEILHRDQRAWVSQRELGVDVPDFATGMRAVVREDPDVIVVGEMRDRQTVMAALMAAETGHLVLSSLHTTDAAETVNRIVELFPTSSAIRFAWCWPNP